MDSPDPKEQKLQDQRQPILMPESYPGARRAKRMKCEVGVVEDSLREIKSAVVMILYIY